MTVAQLLIMLLVLGFVIWLVRAISGSGAKSSGTKLGNYIIGRTVRDEDDDVHWLEQKTLEQNATWLIDRWNRFLAVKEAGQATEEFPHWYFDDITDAQRQRIARMGLTLRGLPITKGQASDLIGLGEEVSPENIELLEFFNVPTRGLNQTTARPQIDRLTASEENRERWEKRPATRAQKDMLRFFGATVPKGLLQRDAEKLVADLIDEHPEKSDEWDNLGLIHDEFADADFREDVEIKKPSRKIVQEAIDALVAQGTSLEDLAGDPYAVADEILRRYPQLQRDV